MNAPVRQLLFWSPRTLGVFFALLVSLLALNVFGKDYGLRETMAALTIHLIPATLIPFALILIVLVVLVLSWRREWVGGVLFTALAVFYEVTTRGRFGWGGHALIAGPLVLLGLLFLVNWRCRLELRPGS